jgi:L-glyceraldehyde 3-phosphate reductase
VSRVAQLEENLAALANLEFTAAELAEIDEHAVEGDINLWKRSSSS